MKEGVALYLKQMDTMATATEDEAISCMDMDTVVCYNCRRKGHFASDCKQPTTSKSEVRFLDTLLAVIAFTLELPNCPSS